MNNQDPKIRIFKSKNGDDSMTKKKKAVAVIVSLCILVAIAGAVTAAHFLTKEKPVLPPVRMNENSDWTYQLADLSFSTSIKDPELKAIVLLEVKNWLGEREDGGTYYEAEIIKCYKGDINSKIKLIQIGNSKDTADDYPLFTYGNRLLVALAETSETYVTTDGKEIKGDLYYILNSNYGTMKVDEDNDGNLYLMHYYCNQYPNVICPMGDTSPLTFSVVDSEFREQVNLNAKENDSFLPICQHIYLMSDFEKYLETVDWSDNE